LFVFISPDPASGLNWPRATPAAIKALNQTEWEDSHRRRSLRVQTTTTGCPEGISLRQGRILELQ